MSKEKEYAERLINKFRTFSDCINDDYDYSKKEENFNAKQYAIICVDEILNTIRKTTPKNYECEHIVDFQEKVKKQIEIL